MHFKCVDNALQRVDNGSKRICNVTQFIVKTLTMFNKCLRMDEKCFSMRWQLFPTVDPNTARRDFGAPKTMGVLCFQVLGS